MPNTRLILVRHGETLANLQQMWYGSLDAPLTARGEAQVAATAHFLGELHRRTPVDQIYVSPLPRARSTAAAIAAALALTPVVTEGLREFSIGDWEGRTYRDLIDNEDLWGRWRADPGFAPPNGESPRSFTARVLHDLTPLVAKHPGEMLMFVSHGGVIGCLLDAWLGEGRGDWAHGEPHNCAISLLETDGSTWQGHLINSTDHLPAAALIAEQPAYAGV